MTTATKISYRQFKKELLAFLKERFGDIGDTTIRTARDGAKYSEYCPKDGFAWISMDGSPMYELINYGSDGWRFQGALVKFLSDRGLWYEQGHAWNMNIYPDGF